MRRIDTVTPYGEEAIIEQYENFGELLKTMKSRPRRFDGSRYKDISEDWEGVNSLEEAEEMLIYGWEDRSKVESIKSKVSDMEKRCESSRIGFKNDIVGFAPVVPAAIIGIPQNMISCTRKPKKDRVISLVVNAVVSAFVDAEEVLDWGAELLGHIANLEKQGWRVRLEVCFTFSREDTKLHVLKVKVKDERQPFDIKRLMYPLAHVSMLRVICFEWYRKLPDAEYIDGYGRPIRKWRGEERQAAIGMIADTKNGYFIETLDDIESILQGIK